MCCTTCPILGLSSVKAKFRDFLSDCARLASTLLHKGHKLPLLCRPSADKFRCFSPWECGILSWKIMYSEETNPSDHTQRLGQAYKGSWWVMFYSVTWKELKLATMNQVCLNVKDMDGQLFIINSISQPKINLFFLHSSASCQPYLEYLTVRWGRAKQ